MNKRCVILLFVLLPMAYAASSSLMPLRDADVVLVGDIVSGQAADRGTEVDVNVSVLVDRVLKGDLPAGQSIALAWQFNPLANDGPQITTQVVRAHALFFLHKNVSDKNGDPAAYEVIRGGFYTMAMGGYFMPVPPGLLHTPFVYAPNASLEVKLAGELGAAIEALAAKNGDALDVQYAPPPFGGSALPAKAPRNDVDQFQALCHLFDQLTPQAAADVSHYFAASPYVHLQAIGLLGELKLKETSAILAIEKNMEALGHTEQAFRFGYASMLDIRDKPAELNAVGRMAIAESAWFGFDGMAVHTLAGADGLTAVPYLRVMLDNPNPDTRKTALQGLCSTLTRNGESPGTICSVWPGQFDTHRVSNAVDSSPQAEDAERTEAMKAWLIAHHPELAELKAPSWYKTPKPAPPEEIAVTPERHRELAFNILLFRLSQRSNAAAAALKLSSDDKQALDEIVTKLMECLKINNDARLKTEAAARLANQSPDPAAFCTFSLNAGQILRDGLSQLQSRLSPAGNRSIESYLDRWPVHQYVDNASARPFFVKSGGPQVACRSN